MLTIVSTPIGNLEDITLRCLDALRAADAILCEDTRRSLKLVFRFELKKPRLQRYNEHDEHSVRMAMELLQSGKKAVLVTDSGTPCISDPGWKLV
ncbi:MAG: rRNA (cytidine-2'-O-)-methyltransferase, partial [Deltaproteobacteria bacterium]|nr:rRNA (cytidine-2'-O-)-methyltransferase [Deltaproteobacteria bacterium]